MAIPGQADVPHSVRMKWGNVPSDEGRRIALIENGWAAPRNALRPEAPFNKSKATQSLPTLSD